MSARRVTRRNLLLGTAALAPLLSRQAAAFGEKSRFIPAVVQHGGRWDARLNGLRRLAWELQRRTSVEVRARGAAAAARQPASCSTTRSSTSAATASFPPLQRRGGGEPAPLPHLRRLPARRRERRQRTGSGFDASFRRELARVLPQSPLAAVPSHARACSRRFFLLDSAPGRLLQQAAAARRATLGKRAAVMYSQNDLAGAWSRDEGGDYEFEVSPGGEPQRELAIRDGHQPLHVRALPRLQGRRGPPAASSSRSGADEAVESAMNSQPFNAWKLVSLSPLPVWALVLLGAGAGAGHGAGGLGRAPRALARAQGAALGAAASRAGDARSSSCSSPGIRHLQVARMKNRVAVLVDRSASHGLPGASREGRRARRRWPRLLEQRRARRWRRCRTASRWRCYGFDPELAPVLRPSAAERAAARRARTDILSALRAAEGAGTAGARKLSGVLLLQRRRGQRGAARRARSARRARRSRSSACRSPPSWWARRR